MNTQRLAKIGSFFLVLTVLAFLFADIPTSGAQPLTHTVVRGDTLWDLCEKYYGDPDLWPKLWEMNPFITNPHLLKPGDVITLFEVGPVEGAEPTLRPPPGLAKPAGALIKGIDVSSLTNVSAMGYLSPVEVVPLGYIRSSDSSKLILGKGDTAFVEVRDYDNVHVGDQLVIAEASPMLWHPLTKSRLGYTVDTHGTLTVKERLKKPFIRAEIIDSFKDVLVGDMVLPYEPISACVQPVSTADKLYGNIVATKSMSQIIGKYSVVYLDSGFQDGILRGHVFEAIKLHKAPTIDYERATLREIVDKIVGDLPKEQYLANLWQRLTEGDVIYETAVGKLIIVETRPHTSTAVVLSSLEELSKGDLIRGTSWLEAPDYITGMPLCSIE